MAKVKTRDLILDIALLLFNERGERRVNSVDLAYEMNISPGNLYYHFKGKEEIVEELYAHFHASLLLVIEDESTANEIDTQGFLAYLSLISDTFVKYRFITRDLTGLCAHYQNIALQATKVMQRLHGQLLALISRTLSFSSVEHIDNAPRLLADNVFSTLLHASSCDGLLNDVDSGHGAAPNSLQDRLHLLLLPFLDS